VGGPVAADRRRLSGQKDHENVAPNWGCSIRHPLSQTPIQVKPASVTPSTLPIVGNVPSP